MYNSIYKYKCWYWMSLCENFF